MASDRGGRPRRLGDTINAFLADAGLTERIEQASIVSEWARVVGPQIAAVTEAYAVTADGTLFVGVNTSAWMNELSLMEPQLVRALNHDAVERTGEPGREIRRIRWRLRRQPGP